MYFSSGFETHNPDGFKANYDLIIK